MTYARRGRPGDWYVVTTTASDGAKLYWVGLISTTWLHLFTRNNALAAQFDTEEQAAFNVRMIGMGASHCIEKHRWKEPA